MSKTHILHLQLGHFWTPDPGVHRRQLGMSTGAWTGHPPFRRASCSHLEGWALSSGQRGRSYENLSAKVSCLKLTSAILDMITFIDVNTECAALALALALALAFSLTQSQAFQLI